MNEFVEHMIEPFKMQFRKDYEHILNTFLTFLDSNKKRFIGQNQYENQYMKLVFDRTSASLNIIIYVCSGNYINTCHELSTNKIFQLMNINDMKKLLTTTFKDFEHEKFTPHVTNLYSQLVDKTINLLDKYQHRLENKYEEKVIKVTNLRQIRQFERDFKSNFILPPYIIVDNDAFLDNYNRDNLNEFLSKIYDCNSPWLKQLLNGSYTDEQLFAIKLYQTFVYRYINSYLRKIEIPNHLLSKDKTTFKQQCNSKYRGNESTHYCLTDETKKRMFKFANEYANQINCPISLGLPIDFYNLPNKKYYKQMNSVSEKLVKILIDLSHNISRNYPRTEALIVFRGLTFTKNEPHEKIFPSVLTGFTSCSYTYVSSIYFIEVHSLKEGWQYDPDVRQGFMFIMNIPTNINMFSTDMTSDVAETELVITDSIRIEYLFDKSFIIYSYPYGSNYKTPIIHVPCNVYKLE